jgi:beta-N-acetylhexosaminidase
MDPRDRAKARPEDDGCGVTARAAIYGCAGLALLAEERAFFRDAEPWGFILFQRNCDSAEQIRALIGSLRDCVGWDAPVLIDQEGGRVQRLKPPRWRAAPPAALFGKLHAKDPALARESLKLNIRLIAAELASLGITVDCLPVLDVPQAGAHDVIGDRAYAKDPGLVATLARFACEALMEGGILPVIKHMPGHGRAHADSHHALPVVDAPKAELEAVDFQPFKALRDMPLGMTAHVVFTAFDPDRPATTSPIMIEIIREEIGFDGLLMTDDLSMKALSAPMGERVRAALHAGCDLVLHCNGERAEMEAVAAEAPMLSGAASVRAEAALARLHPPQPFDVAWATARLSTLTAA